MYPINQRMCPLIRRDYLNGSTNLLKVHRRRSMDKAKKEEMFRYHQNYIKLIVNHFLMRYKTYLFMIDDLIGECNMRFVTICDKYNPEKDTKFSTFLHSQLNYYMRNLLKSEVRTQVAEETFVATMFVEDAYDPFQFEELLRSAALTPNQKDVLRLRYVCDQTYQEVADEMGVSKTAIFKTEARAIDTLRREL
jgi:RNA polymerase sigma factor (sigma-70 family)